MGFCGRDFGQFEAEDKSPKIEQPEKPPGHPAKLLFNKRPYRRAKKVFCRGLKEKTGPVFPAGICRSVKYGKDQPGKLEFVWGRPSHDVLNVVLQLLLDRGCKGRKLSRGRLLVCAGNAETDFGTTELNVPYDTARAVVIGLVGSAAGREYLYYREAISESPTFEQIDQNPMKAPLPKPHNVGSHYALGEELPKGLLIEDAENPGASSKPIPSSPMQ